MAQCNRARTAATGEGICIVGAGLVGSLLAAYLARRGFPVSVFDKNADPRQVDLSTTRPTLNLSLSNRGLKALDRVGIGPAVRRLTVPTYGRLVHGSDGNVVYQAYGNEREATYSVRRTDLNLVLLDHAEREFGVRFHFNERCLDVDLATATVQLENTRTGLVRHHRAERIFAADGVYSAVRLRLQKTKRFNFSQEYLDSGYTEVNVPASATAPWTERTDAVHLWPRGDYMLLGLPNTDSSFVCSLHLPLDGEHSFDSLVERGKLVSFFEGSFPDAAAVVSDLSEVSANGSINHIVSVRCEPWTHADRIALIGDAAHAIFPYFAQGANAGFEDCLTLDECLEERGDDWHQVLGEYERRRKPNTDAIADMSREHYRELRDLVSHPEFQLRKRIELMLAELDAERFKSLYTMVTFTSLPYAEAFREGRRQRALVDRIMQTDDIGEKTDDELKDLLAEEVFKLTP